ncbi:MAG: hypothetical protein JXA81_13895 [Sedimentisphaerales bacterium]|nr:hypothetical protein [Sedimentisphaerales bacterium]
MKGLMMCTYRSQKKNFRSSPIKHWDYIYLLFVFVTVSSVIAKDTELTPLEMLGKHIFEDKVSTPRETISCADCHAQEAGWTSPDATQNILVGIIPGATGFFANRSPNSAAYAAFSPIFNYDAETGFYGGNMWGGQVHGYRLGHATSDQALFPIVSPVEHGNNEIDVLTIIAESDYADLWEEVFDAPVDTETTTGPFEFFGGVPYADYYKVGLALGAYQQSPEVSQFSSKYDFYLKGQATLTNLEKSGLKIFNDKGKCSSCHISKTGPNGEPPLFTDNRFWNIGVPKNPVLPIYEIFPDFIDLGLGQTLRDMADPNTFSPFAEHWRTEPFAPQTMLDMTNEQLLAFANESDGKFHTPTLRNIMKAPYPGFVKAYMHNGAIKTLLGAIELHNSRDTYLDPPEFEGNMETELVGNLGLTLEEQLSLIAFLNTLTDGYEPVQQ